MNQMTPKAHFEMERAYSVSDRLADMLGFGRRAVAAKRLSSLDDHLLRDIGVNRDEINTITGLYRQD